MKIFGSFQRDRACDSFSLFFLRLFILFFFSCCDTHFSIVTIHLVHALSLTFYGMSGLAWLIYKSSLAFWSILCPSIVNTAHR